VPNSEVISLLNQAQIDFVSKVLPLEECQTMSTIADQANYELPSDFLRMIYVELDNKAVVNLSTKSILALRAANET
jgi:hypothetical protein